MFERLRHATIAAVLVTVVLLGLPLSVFGAQVARQSQMTELTSRAQQLANTIDVRQSAGIEIDKGTLAPYAHPKSGLRAHVSVQLANGSELESSKSIDGKLVRTDLVTSSHGDRVVLSVSWWDIFWKTLPSILLALGVSVVAVIAGIFVANWQARRLSEPLVYLAASAEQLGAGQVRPRLEDSGIEEIDLVAAELARSADRMARRLAAERQFASDASHQLRTPLTALSMRLEEIELLADSDDVREEARISLEQVERLEGTVRELLDQRNKVGAAPNLESLALGEIVCQQREEWAPVFADAGRELVFEVPPGLRILASPGALTQVIATLLENSLVHGAGVTTLKASVSGSNASIEVSDQGEGVDDEIAPKVFERNVTSGQGTGLGLAVARDLVTADGGRLELAQRRPATFRIFLRVSSKSLDPERVIPLGAKVDPLRPH